MEIARVRHTELTGEAHDAVQDLLKEAFPDAASDYYASESPACIVLLRHANRVIGHAAVYVRSVAVYVRSVFVGDEPITIGLVGGVAVAAGFRRQGHGKRLLREAHAFLAEHAIQFSVLFAYDTAQYRSSGYQPIANETRFLDTDGACRRLVYRGGMVAEVGNRRWPGTTLDLRHPTV
jgi:predicted acetyltransferase